MGGTEAIRRWVPTTQAPFSIDDVIAALPERVGSTARDPAMRRLEAARVALIELRQEGAIVPEAILRERRIKRWRRGWKIALIENENPGWEDVGRNFFAS
jgi:predicted GIY-YIG superfamily endonuclease